MLAFGNSSLARIESCRSLLVAGKLDRVQLGVCPAAPHQIRVAPNLGDPAAVNYNNPVGHAHG